MRLLKDERRRTRCDVSRQPDQQAGGNADRVRVVGVDRDSAELDSLGGLGRGHQIRPRVPGSQVTGGPDPAHATGLGLRSEPGQLGGRRQGIKDNIDIQLEKGTGP